MPRYCTPCRLAALDPRAALINLINGPSHTDGTHLQPGTPSEGEFRRYLNLGLHTAPTADQDNHKRNWGDSTDARTAVLAPALTKAALLTAMRQRRVYATEDRNLRLVVRVSGQLLGSRITGASVPTPGTPLSISLEITDDNEPSVGYVVEVFLRPDRGHRRRGRRPHQSVTGNGTHNISGVTYQGGAQYVYLRIRQADGNRGRSRSYDHALTGIQGEPVGELVEHLSRGGLPTHRKDDIDTRRAMHSVTPNSPMPHAWCIDERDLVVDGQWGVHARMGSAYFGVVVDVKRMRRRPPYIDDTKRGIRS